MERPAEEWRALAQSRDEIHRGRRFVVTRTVGSQQAHRGREDRRAGPAGPCERRGAPARGRGAQAPRGAGGRQARGAAHGARRCRCSSWRTRVRRASGSARAGPSTSTASSTCASPRGDRRPRARVRRHSLRHQPLEHRARRGRQPDARRLRPRGERLVDRVRPSRGAQRRAALRVARAARTDQPRRRQPERPLCARDRVLRDADGNPAVSLGRPARDHPRAPGEGARLPDRGRGGGAAPALRHRPEAPRKDAGGPVPDGGGSRGRPGRSAGAVAAGAVDRAIRARAPRSRPRAADARAPLRPR